jgi:hypothetical protein
LPHLAVCHAARYHFAARLLNTAGIVERRWSFTVMSDAIDHVGVGFPTGAMYLLCLLLKPMTGEVNARFLSAGVDHRRQFHWY